jgi:hypothetical protein
MTAFRLIAILHDLTLVNRVIASIALSRRESRESLRKLLQNTCKQLAAIHAHDPHL